MSFINTNNEYRRANIEGMWNITTLFNLHSLYLLDIATLLFVDCTYSHNKTQKYTLNAF